jgi:hypothetical protein
MMGDLELPAEPGLGRKAAEMIVLYLSEVGLGWTGGCRAFYTPQEWQERGEEYATDSELVIVHDGGDLSYLLNWDKFLDQSDYQRFEELQHRLKRMGLYIEGCTCWYSAVYPI